LKVLNACSTLDVSSIKIAVYEIRKNQLNVTLKNAKIELEKVAWQLPFDLTV
jgi:hypothetical protein